MKKEILLLIFVLLLGLGLRLHNLAGESLWIDEAVTLHEARLPVQEMVDEVIRLEGSPYGHHLLLHYWIKIFGDSELSLRMPSVIFGVLSILLLWLIVKPYGKKLALLSSVFMSTSMLQVLYSQEARLYALFSFLTLLATYFLLRRKQWLYIFTMAIAMYVNYLTIFLIIFHSLYVYHKKIRGYILWVVAIAVLSMPLLMPLLAQFSARHHHLINGLTSRGLPAFIAPLGLVFFMLPIFGCLFLLVVGWRFRSKLEKFMLPIFALLGVAYLLLLDRIIVSLSLIRHSFFLVPILYVLLARSILCRRKTLGNLLIGIVLFLNVLALGTYYNETTKLPWQEAGMILDANTHGDAVIIMDDSISANLLLEYYTEKQYNVNGEVRNVDQIWVIETKKFKGPQITGERFELDGITLTSTNFIK